MKTKEEILKVFTLEEGAWWSYKEGIQEGYSEAFNSLRNQAAIAAMQGILASDSPMSACSETSQESGVPLQQVLAKYAVLCADALIEKLKKK